MSVHRSVEGKRHIVTALGLNSGCIATGATAKEAERKAAAWVLANLKRNRLIGAIGILDLELTQLCDALALLSTDSE